MNNTGIAARRVAASQGRCALGEVGALLLSAALLVGCRRDAVVAPPGAKLPAFDAATATNAFAHTARFVALGSRVAGAPSGAHAARYLHDTLRAFGATNTIVDSFDDETPAGPRRFHNVLTEFAASRATAPRIVLLSHFDTKTGVPGDTPQTPFVGANDGGSSTGLLLALAEMLAQSAMPPPCHLLLAFLDGEECAVAYSDRDGLHGSRRLAQSLRRQNTPVRAVILADMIGDRDLCLQIPRNSTVELRLLALECAARLGYGDHISLYNGHILDDHQPFLDAGFAALDLIDFQFGSAPGRNDYWHTTADTMDKLDPHSFAITGRIIMAMIAELGAPQSRARTP